MCVYMYYTVYTYLVNNDSYSIQVNQGVRTSNISMAKSQPEPVTCGYDYSIFIGTPPEIMKCPVCLLIVREPHQSSCCGKLFCQVLL